MDEHAKPVFVQALTCANCRHTIFSRARHDMHSCPCGGVSVDGGFDYLRMSWKPDLVLQQPKPRRVQVNASQAELYHDWDRGLDQFGVLDPECVLVEVPQEPEC